MKQLQLGVIGLGSVVREIYRHLYFSSSYSDLLDIRAVVEIDKEVLSSFCEENNIGTDRRYDDYKSMLDNEDLDAVQVNTPDHLHAGPVISALQKGIDVMVPKPAAASITDLDAMTRAARESGRLLTVDFHKRQDPRILEAAARYRSGRYGIYQTSVWYMLDKLLVADPNRNPRFFASPDFAEKNTPVSFLTVHMADSLMQIIREKPLSVRTAGFSNVLPALRPKAVNGYDMVDTEIIFESGGSAHIITGWHIPDTAHATTVQSSRIICSRGVIDLDMDRNGIREMHPDGIFEANPLFRNFTEDGTVSGYGISSPGELYRSILRHRSGELTDEERDRFYDPFETGFYTTLILEAAEQALETAKEAGGGVRRSGLTDCAEFCRSKLGEERAAEYGY
jgi:predicted dehydrogenase